jgi:hypothetical protein
MEIESDTFVVSRLDAICDAGKELDG